MSCPPLPEVDSGTLPPSWCRAADAFQPRSLAALYGTIITISNDILPVDQKNNLDVVIAAFVTGGMP
jgi:hypothetical protein